MQLWTNLTRERLKKALRERWNKIPEVCFCKNPEKHREHVTVPNGYVECRRSVYDTSRGSCYLGIDQIEEFLCRYRSVDATHDELEELRELDVALRKQWGYVRAMVSSESPEVQRGSDNLVSARDRWWATPWRAPSGSSRRNWLGQDVRGRPGNS